MAYSENIMKTPPASLLTNNEPVGWAGFFAHRLHYGFFAWARKACAHPTRLKRNNMTVSSNCNFSEHGTAPDGRGLQPPGHFFDAATI